MPFEFGLGSFISASAAISIMSISLVIFLGGKTATAKAFVPLSFIAGFWSIGMLFVAATPESSIVLGDFLHRMSYVIGLLAFFSLFYFAYVFAFTEKESGRKNLSIFLLILSIIFSFIILKTNIIFSGTKWVGSINSLEINMWAIQIGSIPFLFDIISITLFISSFYLIYKKTKTLALKHPEKRNSHISLFYILLLGYIPPGIFSMILPSLGLYQFDWLGPASTIFFIIALAHSIMTYNQMNIRVAFTEVLILSSVCLLFVSIFI